MKPFVWYSSIFRIFMMFPCPNLTPPWSQFDTPMQNYLAPRRALCGCAFRSPPERRSCNPVGYHRIIQLRHAWGILLDVECSFWILLDRFSSRGSDLDGLSSAPVLMCFFFGSNLYILSCFRDVAVWVFQTRPMEQAAQRSWNFYPLSAGFPKMDT